MTGDCIHKFMHDSFNYIATLDGNGIMVMCCSNLFFSYNMMGYISRYIAV